MLADRDAADVPEGFVMGARGLQRETYETEDRPAAYRAGDVLPDGSVLLIGNIDPRSEAADRLLDGITVALQEFDTETLLGIADYRDSIHKDGWMQKLIREYVDVWR